MFAKPSHALLAAMALLAAPALAQETAPAEGTPPAAETQQQQTPAAEAPAATASPDEAATGEDASSTAGATAPAEQAAPTEGQPSESQPGEAQQGEPRVGSYYLKEEHGDWMVRCIRAGQGKDPCEMYKLLDDADGNAVAEFTLIPLSNGEVAAGATLIAPLETDLIQGLGLQIDSGEMRGYPFSVCTPVGCVSRLGFTEAELTAMKRGSRATVQLVPFGGEPDQAVRLDVSLSGFTAAYDALTAYADAPAPAAEDNAAGDGASTDGASEEGAAETPAE